jgi:hypothetical protein
MTEAQNSAERIEDLVFQNLIRRWTEAREWEWVQAAQIMVGHIWEERERNAPPTGTPENPVVGVVVDDPWEHGHEPVRDSEQEEGQ